MLELKLERMKTNEGSVGYPKVNGLRDDKREKSQYDCGKCSKADRGTKEVPAPEFL
jgi:hypothetical protein